MSFLKIFIVISLCLMVSSHHHHKKKKPAPKPVVPPQPTPQQQDNELISAISGQVGIMDPIANEPSNAQSLVTDIKSIGKSNFIQCTTAQLSSELAPYNLPQNVVSSINSIIYMQSTTFQGFNFIIKGTKGELTQYAGAARNVQGTVQIAFVNTITTGNIVQQYSTHVEHYKSCHFCIKIRCCKKHTKTIQVPIGMNAQQLIDVESALQFAGKNYIQQQLANPPAQFKTYANLQTNYLSLFDVQDLNEFVGVVQNKLQDFLKR